MKLVVVSVLLEDKLETPTPHLDDGEHIITRVVELDQLDAELKGASHYVVHFDGTCS
jgi:ADP-ribose pyrophosphatase